MDGVELFAELGIDSANKPMEGSQICILIPSCTAKDGTSIASPQSQRPLTFVESTIVDFPLGYQSAMNTKSQAPLTGCDATGYRRQCAMFT